MPRLAPVSPIALSRAARGHRAGENRTTLAKNPHRSPEIERAPTSQLRKERARKGVGRPDGSTQYGRVHGPDYLRPGRGTNFRVERETGRSHRGSVARRSTTRGAPTRGRLRTAAAGLTILLLATAARAAPAPANADANAARVRFERMKRIFTLARAATRDIPADTWDPGAVLAVTGKDYRKIREWVADETDWIPYRGVLRGARGVLMDRVGSSLDRSLLLADLLRRAGFEVRIEHGTIPPGKLPDVRKRLREKKHAAPGPGPSREEVDAELATIARILDVPLDEVRRNSVRARLAREQQAEDTAERTAIIRKSLGAQVGIGTGPPGKPGLTDAAKEILRDGYRVAIRHGTGWLPLDPLAPDADPEHALWEKPSETWEPKEIPDALRHVLRLKVVAERCSGGKLSRQVVLDESVPAADLLGRKVTLTLQALDWPRDLPKVTLDPAETAELGDRTKKALEEQTEWMPILDLDGRTVHQKSFRADGTVVDHPAISLNARKVASATGRLSSALGGAGSGDSELTGVFVEFEFDSPAGPPVRAERAWLDRPGPARRTGGVGTFTLDAAGRRDRAVELGGIMNFFALPCRPSPAWLAHRRVEALLENRVPMLGVLYAAMKSEGDRVSRYLDRARPAPMELYALAGNRFGGPGSEDVVVDGLDLLSSFSLPSREGGELHLHQGLDLVRNRVSPRPFSGADARSARFAQGVKDTVVESLTLPRSLGPRSNTADAYLRSLGGGAKWVVLTRAGDLTDGATGLGPDSRVRVLRALKAGRTVVAPPPGETGTEAWWEVDPETGSTIGRIGDGRGGAAEEVVLMMNDAYSLITTMKGVLACRDAKSDLQMACCLLQNAGFGFYGLALGRSLSGAISDLWGVAVNVAYTEATGQIDLCGS